MEMELQLPEPVPANRGIADDDTKTECCVCFELLESRMAAWSGVQARLPWRVRGEDAGEE
jgi:hypothetical protein